MRQVYRVKAEKQIYWEGVCMCVYPCRQQKSFLNYGVAQDGTQRLVYHRTDHKSRMKRSRDEHHKWFQLILKISSGWLGNMSLSQAQGV